jgi:tetratricopeptide (TPR) repeat protein
VARHGARAVREPGTSPRDVTSGTERRQRSDEFVPERFVRTDRASAGGHRQRSLPPPAARAQQPATLPADVVGELASAAGPDWSHLRERVTERMTAAIGAYQRGRYRDASRMLRTVVDAVPNAPSARELLGLSQYQQGYWKAARTNLEAFGGLSGSVDQHPVRMDCERALGRHRRVELLYDELRKGSPEPEVLAEGRLVLAGDRADRGDLAGAIALLTGAGAGRPVRNPAERHLRQWYVLGDLMERSGELARARELFHRIFATDPDAYDVRDRLDSLGHPARHRPSSKRRHVGR